MARRTFVQAQDDLLAVLREALGVDAAYAARAELLDAHMGIIRAKVRVRDVDAITAMFKRVVEALQRRINRPSPRATIN